MQHASIRDTKEYGCSMMCYQAYIQGLKEHDKSNSQRKTLNNNLGDIWLTQLVEHSTFHLRVVISGPTLSVEII